MSIVFDGSLRVGHDQIDREHQAIVSHINNFLEKLATRQDRAVLDSCYQAIMDYMVLHFSHENELMRIHKFSDRQIHEYRHEKLLVELRERSRYILGCPDEDLADIMSFFHDWFVFHIKTCDAKLADFLNRRPSP